MNSALPMFGGISVYVQSIQPTLIHGDLYFDAVVLPENPERPGTPEALEASGKEPEMVDASELMSVRIPEHLCEQSLQAGDRIALTFLMGQVDSVAVLP